MGRNLKIAKSRVIKKLIQYSAAFLTANTGHYRKAVLTKCLLVDIII
jgi:hypothetical protein